MDQNKQKCIECMEKIERRLDSLGHNTFMTSNKETILCRASGSGIDKKDTINNRAVVTTVSTTQCPHAKSVTKCPYPSCIYPNSQCSIHNHNSNNNNSNTDEDNNSGVLESFICGDSLFRIMPNNINTGLMLHVIKLHGETCELKMSFDYSDSTISEIVNVIQFLIK